MQTVTKVISLVPFNSKLSFFFFSCFLFLFFETLVGNIQFTVFLFNCCKDWHLGTFNYTMTQSNNLRVWLHQFALIVSYGMTAASIVFSVLWKRENYIFIFLSCDSHYLEFQKVNS